MKLTYLLGTQAHVHSAGLTAQRPFARDFVALAARFLVHTLMTVRPRRLTVLAALTLALASASSACATVAPYERERLARPDMEMGRNADAKAGEEHAVSYREGSSGGTASSGGGCGCN